MTDPSHSIAQWIFSSVVSNGTWTAMVNVVKTTFLQHSQQKPKLAIDKTQLSAIQTTYTLKQVSQCHPDPRQIGPTEPVFDVVQHLMSLLTVLRQPLQPEQTKKPTFEVVSLSLLCRVLLLIGPLSLPPITPLLSTMLLLLPLVSAIFVKLTTTVPTMDNPGPVLPLMKLMFNHLPIRTISHLLNLWIIKTSPLPIQTSVTWSSTNLLLNHIANEI
ncbi:hypothetical protein MJO28_005139 [Puccinia striiformis f. sp. tritici]|uniref:Uncharacterized protein n=1 Tax=Puccinia striiformis f. sp. tritici TaxID=168172 RepID=A0ACC0EKK6_9BASI|nr:hypothetical protein MJO28_005139 [Puccinia striiformis f. sp. tritici]